MPNKSTISRKFYVLKLNTVHMVIMQVLRVVTIAAVITLLTTMAIIGTANARMYQFHLSASANTCYEFPYNNAKLVRVDITAQDISPDAQVAILVLLNDRIIDARSVSKGSSYSLEINPASPGKLKLVMSHDMSTEVIVDLEIKAYERAG